MNRRFLGLALAIGLAAVVVVAALAAAGIIGRAQGGAADPPRFGEEALAAGLEHVYDGDFEYFVGGGVAVFDCSDDGRPDLYFAGGSNPAALFANESVRAGALRFARLPSAATDLESVTGAYPLDIDGDRRIDLAVLRHGENVLLRGLGGCQFERANEPWAFDGGDEWTTAFSATWEGSNRLPTLAFGNYIDPAKSSASDLCFENVLVRPEPAAKRYGHETPLKPAWCSLSMLFTDWDRSGRRDLRIANDREYYNVEGDGEEQLWRVADGEPPRLYTIDDGWAPVRIWGMGIASYDLTGDGYPEYFLSNQGDNKLQTLASPGAGPAYRDMAITSGVTASRPYAGDTNLPSTAWHAEFQDVNNDGFVDLFVAKGNVEAMPDYAAKDPSNLLLGRAEGTFVEGAEAAGLVDFGRARGAAVADFNLDGLLDLVTVTRRDNVRLWRNFGSGDAAKPAPMGNWLGIRIDDTEHPNHDAIGAWVSVRVGDRIMEREVIVGGGHAGGQLGPVHFGLGSDSSADVRVTWPDGEIGPWLPAMANSVVIVERGATEVRPWPVE